MLLVAVSITLLAAAATSASGVHTKRPISGVLGTRVAMFEAERHVCPAARRALRYYRAAYTRHREAMGLPGAPRLVRYGCGATRRRAVEWRGRAREARRALASWTREQYQWWRWMPRGSKEYRVASCETGYGRAPNFAHDSGTYVGAWGTYRPAYADDAHRVGNLSWDETIRRLGRMPTPREQWEAMQSHRAAHGGWAGWGCRGA